MVIEGANFRGNTNNVKVTIDGIEQGNPTSVSDSSIVVPLSALRSSSSDASIVVETRDGIVRHSPVTIDVTPSFVGIDSEGSDLHLSTEANVLSLIVDGVGTLDDVELKHDGVALSGEPVSQEWNLVRFRVENLEDGVTYDTLTLSVNGVDYSCAGDDGHLCSFSASSDLTVEADGVSWTDNTVTITVPEDTDTLDKIVVIVGEDEYDSDEDGVTFSTG